MFYRILWNVIPSYLSFFEYSKNVFINLDMLLHKLQDTTLGYAFGLGDMYMTNNISFSGKV
jgi:hypothetical protein